MYGDIPDTCADSRKGEQLSEKAWWFIFAGTRLLIKMHGDSGTVPFIRSPRELGLEISRRHYIGSIGGKCCYAAEADSTAGPTPSGWELRGLRSSYGVLQEELFKHAILAVHILGWEKTTRYCGRCGSLLIDRNDVRAKECGPCGHLIFPRISPAIIVAIERGDTLLLARASRFSENIYSVLAGFVEPGETLEEAVFREVKEEVGITVKNIRYFGSQPWPFPDSLMIGFNAEYGEGEIRIDGDEIVDAKWFPADNLPDIPGPISIARQLIDSFVDKHRGKTGS